jgi:16S rRNA (cytosine967-C5)-methyltransferase
MISRPPRFHGRQHSARSLAFQVLLEADRGNGFIQEILDKHLSQAELSPADRRLATHLAYGVVRRRSTLDALVRPFLKREPHQIEPWLWNALRLGAFQLALMTHIPVHAAIHETVELAGLFERTRAKGFLNAVLRALAPLVSDQRLAQPGADALPMEQRQYRKLERPIFPDPIARPVEYLAAAFALPRWLVGRWLDRYGWDECNRLGFWFASPPPLWLRYNSLRTDRDAYLAALARAGITGGAGEHPQAIRLADSVAIRDLPGFEEGRFAVQDESAMRVASALAPASGSRVLDLCAAPGGKTTHLAELMRNQGELIACDVDDRRLRTLTALCQRLGINIAETCRLRPEQNDEPPSGPFDAILVDVPCSNTGVLGRRPEARWRLRPQDLQHLVPLQTKLLLQAAERIKPGGTIVYSTCSIEPEENRTVVQNVLQVMPHLSLEAEENQVPGKPSDGGYWARLKLR